jgi:7-cyano-7-deazaguanine synthase
VVLLSGGLDSATVLAVARSERFQCHCLAFDYGQRHRHELLASERVAASLGAASHRILAVDLRAIGGSALTSDTPVPKDVAQPAGGIPVTYVPARNLIFLSLATAYAETLSAQHLFIGVNAVDFSGYPDCRPEFMESFERTANLATKAGAEGSSLRVHAPLIRMTKAEIISAGARLGVDYSLTHSCYDPPEPGAACGQCDSCRIRRRGFLEAGVADPTRYAHVPQ